MNTIDLSLPKRVNVTNYAHKIKNRSFVSKLIDFIVFVDYYQKPELGSSDDFGTLIFESDVESVSAGVVKFTREYIDSVPASWSEYEFQQIQHDEFIDNNSILNYYKFWSARGPNKEPSQPAENLIPEGSSLLREVNIGLALTKMVVQVADSPVDTSLVRDWGGTWYIYQYPVDPATGSNLAQMKRLAATNFNLSNSPSTCVIPTLTKLTHTYHVLPDGPGESDFIQATDKIQTFGETCIGWPRNTNTVLESSIFTRVSGCLYERVVRYWANSELP